MSRNPATGAFSFTFVSIPGRTYLVSRSSTLNPASWLKLTDIAATGTSTTFTDTPGLAAVRYLYQATLKP